MGQYFTTEFGRENIIQTLFLDPRENLWGAGGGAEYRVIPHQSEALQDGSEPGQEGGQGEGETAGLKLRQVHGD